VKKMKVIKLLLALVVASNALVFGPKQALAIERAKNGKAVE